MRTAGEHITSSGCTAASAAAGERVSVIVTALSSLHTRPFFRGSFLCWIIGRIDIVDRPRTDAVNLSDRLFVGPHIVVGPWLHERDAAGCQRPGPRGVEDAAKPHMQRARDDGD